MTPNKPKKTRICYPHNSPGCENCFSGSVEESPDSKTDKDEVMQEMVCWETKEHLKSCTTCCPKTEEEWEKEFDIKYYSEDLEGIKDFIRNLLSQKDQEWKKISDKYEELLMSVSDKFEGETRHQTALRYIKNAEKGNNSSTKNE